MLYFPAFQPADLSWKTIAFVISIVCVRLDPCSGRSDATMKSGLPEPPYCTFPHADAGNGVTLLVALPAIPTMASAMAAAAAATSPPMKNRFLTHSSFVAKHSALWNGKYGTNAGTPQLGTGETMFPPYAPFFSTARCTAVSWAALGQSPAPPHGPPLVAFTEHRACTDSRPSTIPWQAEVAELVDAPDSKSGSLRGVWVQVPPSAPSSSAGMESAVHATSSSRRGLPRRTRPRAAPCAG